jgi:hypothetical protein
MMRESMQKMIQLYDVAQELPKISMADTQAVRTQLKRISSLASSALHHLTKESKGDRRESRKAVSQDS